MSFGPMNVGPMNNEARDFPDRERHGVQSGPAALLQTLAVPEELEFWVAQRFNAAINLPRFGWASAPEVLSLSFSATRLAAGASPELFFVQRLFSLSNHRAKRKISHLACAYSIVNPALISPCGKSNPRPSIKPVIAGDTTYGVSLLTGTISGSNFAIP